jgi:c-di-GMP-binding flagellar brake protein YcgR
MGFTKKHKPGNSDAVWISQDAGYELTASTAIIKSLLNTLKKERNFITLFHKGYQSFGTMLVDVTDAECKIEKPKDWPGTHTKVRVSFKNKAKVVHHFYTRITSTTRNNLYLDLPKELYKLQRRSNYRVELPKGSYTTFMYNGKKCKFNVQDISLSGMLFYTKDAEAVSEHVTQIKAISVSTPFLNDESISLTVEKGEIVRATFNKRHNIFFYGVRYFPTDPEEENIMKFIRKRELQILRKGISEE